jgi:hypothetical protein
MKAAKPKRTSGGRYEEMAHWNQQCYFTVAKAGRAKVENFKITLSLPKDRAEVITTLMENSSLLHKAQDPELRPINWEEVDRQAAELRKQYEREWNESEA